MRISDWSSDVCSSDLEQLPPDMRLGVAATPEEAAAKTAYLLDHGADFIKTIATGAVLAIGTEPGAPELTEEQLRAIVKVAHARGKRVTAPAQIGKASGRGRRCQDG